MGQIWSTPKASYPEKGCFFSNYPGHEMHLALSLSLIQGKAIDCDCRETGQCPHGPPPIPPLEEFMDSVPARLLLECSPPENFTRPAFKPKWDFGDEQAPLHEPVPFDRDSLWDPIRKRSLQLPWTILEEESLQRPENANEGETRAILGLATPIVAVDWPLLALPLAAGAIVHYA